ncbi:YdjY domain-containing protein [Verrucomicrobiales bacterium]|nr:YdjY domain-containing protein [Verrucomicrobiales bacterium]
MIDGNGNLGDSEHGTRILARIAIAAAISLVSAKAEEPDVEEPEKPVEITQTGDTTYRYGKITFDKKDRSVRIPAKVVQRNVLLEYVLVHENGKTHESILATDASAMRLHTVLLLLRYSQSKEMLNPSVPAEMAVSGETAEEKAGAQLTVTVSWDDPESGEPQTAPIESWITHLDDDDTESPVSPGPFILTGSRIYEGKFVAEIDGNILALYLDPTALINNPRKDNFSDESWLANKSVIPPLDTEVTLVISPTPPK